MTRAQIAAAVDKGLAARPDLSEWLQEQEWVTGEGSMREQLIDMLVEMFGDVGVYDGAPEVEGVLAS